MTPASTLFPDGLAGAVRQLLEQSPQGISEYELLSALRDQGFFDFLLPAPALPEQLFRAHFMLYHLLYRLRDELLTSRQAILQIEVLKIQLLPYQAVTEALSSVDHLRSYYLDLNNLEQTDAAQVYDMIAGFWRRLGKTDQRDAALAELGLQDPVDDATIRQAYRRMVMQHHPDRGGADERLQAINAALAALLD